MAVNADEAFHWRSRDDNRGVRRGPTQAVAARGLSGPYWK
jgi:hypothetical protein